MLTVVAAVLAFTRRPFRRDLAWLAVALPLGVVAQAVLGGFTVREHLAPGFVMAHFGLSMVILVVAVALAWRRSHEPGDGRARPTGSRVWSVRALPPLGALTIFAGTAATAAGPHAGGSPGQQIHRLHFKGADTLDVGRPPARDDRGAVRDRRDRRVAARTAGAGLGAARSSR